jgi:hypothetical protein
VAGSKGGSTHARASDWGAIAERPTLVVALAN